MSRQLGLETHSIPFHTIIQGYFIYVWTHYKLLSIELNYRCCCESVDLIFSISISELLEYDQLLGIRFKISACAAKTCESVESQLQALSNFNAHHQHTTVHNIVFCRMCWGSVHEGFHGWPPSNSIKRTIGDWTPLFMQINFNRRFTTNPNIP